MALSAIDSKIQLSKESAFIQYAVILQQNAILSVTRQDNQDMAL